MDAQTEILSILNREFSSAKTRNPSYSLRSFAKRIDLAPSALSGILNGKRKITRKVAQKILVKLNFDPVGAQNLCQQLKDNYRSGVLKSESINLQQLTSDQFKVLSDWYYFGLLSLAETADFESDPAWIARRLKISVRETHIAVERLVRLGLFKRDKKGALKVTGEGVTTTHEVSDATLRASHAQHLELARESLERDEPNERDITGITMAIDPAKLPEAKKKIQRFRRELCKFLESDKKSEVFRLNIQLHPLSWRDYE